MGDGGLISGLACGVQCRCRTRPCHRQRLVTRQHRPPLRARGYDAVVSRLAAVGRVFRGEVAYIIATDPPTHLSWPSFFPKRRIIFLSDQFYFIFANGKNSRISQTAKIYSTEGIRNHVFRLVLLWLRLPTHSISRRSFRSDCFAVSRGNPSKY